MVIPDLVWTTDPVNSSAVGNGEEAFETGENIGLTVRSSKVRLIKFQNMDFLLNFMNVAAIKSKENYQNIVTCGLKCSPLLLNKAQKSMRGLFSGVPPYMNCDFLEFTPLYHFIAQRPSRNLRHTTLVFDQ